MIRVMNLFIVVWSLSDSRRYRIVIHERRSIIWRRRRGRSE